MQGEPFIFVGLSGQPDVDIQTTNKFIRSHVMRRYRRQQKKAARQNEVSPPHAQAAAADEEEEEEEEEEPGPGNSSACSSSDVSPLGARARALPWIDDDSPPTAAAQLDATSQGSVASEQQPQHLTHVSWSPSHGPQTWLDGEMDPFSSLPILVNERSVMLLQRNASLPLRTSVHADPSGTYKRVCSKDPAWLFMHLYYAACRFPQAADGRDCEAMQYLLQSESAVSESIQGTPNAIDDSTIATVACLANIENLNGEASTAYIHMGGLKRMVQIRGGLSNLGMQGIIRRMVLWSDLLTSLNLQIVPHFPLTVTETPSELWRFTPAPLQAHYVLVTNPELDTITTEKHQIPLGPLLLSLHQLTTFLNLADEGLLPWEACYPDRVYEVEYSIALCLYDDTVVAGSDDQLEIGQLLLQAALLYIYSNLRQTPVGGTIRRVLLSRLRALLDQMDLAYHSTRFPAELLWVLVVGISAAIGAVQAELLNAAWDVCARNQIVSWQEVSHRLGSMPALLEARMATCRAIWLMPP